MRLIGLTGSIATGKSFVSHCLRECDVAVVDTDIIAAQLTKEPEVLQVLAATFGSEIIENGQLNRQALGQIIFHQADARTRLDAIMHPLVKAEMLKQAQAFGREVVVLDVPLLLETDYYQLCERIVVVSTDRATQLKRLLMRDGCDETFARAKIASQMPIGEKLKRADYVIDNAGSREATKKQVVELIDKLNLI